MITEQGTNWVVKLAVDNAYPGRLDTAHALSSASAEFWLRAFADEVEKRAATLIYADSRCVPDEDGICCHRVSEALETLKSELLGGDHEKV